MIDKKKTKKIKISNLRKKIKNYKLNRLLVYKSSKHLYAQIFSINNNKVEISVSTNEKNIKKYLNKNNIYTGNKISANYIGKILSERSINKNIKKVFFDKSGFRYHGRIKQLAESARKNGLIF